MYIIDVPRNNTDRQFDNFGGSECLNKMTSRQIVDMFVIETTKGQVSSKFLVLHH